VSDMKAGRELDALVAEKVFGLKVEWLPAPEHPHHHGKDVPVEPQTCSPPPGGVGAWCAMYWVIPRYSTEIGAAWEVVEKMGSMDLRRSAIRDMSGRYSYACFFHVEKNWLFDVANGGRRQFGTGLSKTVEVPDPWHEALTAPLAICLAALAAIEVAR
jgi:hypothetical protein